MIPLTVEERAALAAGVMVRLHGGPGGIGHVDNIPHEWHLHWTHYDYWPEDKQGTYWARNMYKPISEAEAADLIRYQRFVPRTKRPPLPG